MSMNQAETDKETGPGKYGFLKNLIAVNENRTINAVAMTGALENFRISS